MNGLDTRLATITAIEQYGRVMQAKGLHARARWAQDEVRRLRQAFEAASGCLLPKAA